ncbi:hypothetical protein NFI96_004555 [Prochilodus magdalenae]|nr:hypothetical protein NFI96_004555 [Prochilodus magdalenae]
MKKTAVVALLLVLFQNNLQETEAVEALKSLKPSNELKQLKDIVYQQGTALTELKTEMKYIEKENTGLKTKLAKQIKLTKEVQDNMENLKKEISAQTKELSATKTRLADSEGEVKNLKKDSAEIKTALAASRSELNTMKKESTALKGRMSTNEGDMESLKREVQGVFTAPARGVYYFRFTIWSYNSGYNSGIYLYKNNDLLTFLYGYNYNSYGRFISGGVTVQLELHHVEFMLGDLRRMHSVEIISLDDLSRLHCVENLSLPFIDSMYPHNDGTFQQDKFSRTSSRSSLESSGWVQKTYSLEIELIWSAVQKIRLQEQNG